MQNKLTNLLAESDCLAFSDDAELFAKANEHNGLQGEKIKIDRLIGKQIIFTDFEIIESQYKRAGDTVLKVQIILDNELRIFFTQSAYIRKTLELFSEYLPRKGTIIREDRAFKIK